MSPIPDLSVLNELLKELNEEENFPISVIADEQGLTVAQAAAPGMDADRQSAVVGYFQNAATHTASHLGLKDADEISLFNNNGKGLVCRLFNAGEYRFILAVIVPDRKQGYRRTMGQAIQKIKRYWRKFRGNTT